MTGSLERIQEALARVQGEGTRLNAVAAVLVDRARDLAAMADKRAAAGAAPRPLEGVPFAVKDVIDIVGVPTTMGSRVPVEGTGERTAAVVEGLEELGAIAVAKANCQEFSYGILGDESALGRVVNPVDARLCTGGSSSGSAALVAADVVPLAVGTDTAGSVRVPAACCHVVGFKPTRGALPDVGVFPLAPSFDTVGLFGKSVALVERAFANLGGADQPGSGADSAPSALTSASEDVEAPGSLAVVGLEDALAAAIAAALGMDPLPAPAGTNEIIDETARIYDVMRRREALLVHQSLIEGHRDDYQPGVLAKLESGREISDEAYSDAVEALASVRSRAEQVFAAVDLLAMPVIDGPLERWDALDAGSGARYLRYTVPWNVLGWPAITVPLPDPWRDAAAAPLSVQLVGKPGEDARLLRVAAALE